MNKEKVFGRWVRERYGGRKVSLFGKRWPFIKTFYQKHSSASGSGGGLEFNPKDYNSNNPLERKRLAYEDAKQHSDFYQEVISKGLYPVGTKVNVKKMRHSNIYHLELTMPKVPLAKIEYREPPAFTGISSETHEEERVKKQTAIGNLEREMESRASIIKDIARKRGYAFPKINGREVMSSQLFNTDLTYRSNWARDKSENLVYIDREILGDKLPFARRKRSGGVFNVALEDQVLAFFSIGFFVLSLIFSSLSFTGAVVQTIENNTLNFLGVGSFVIGLILFLFYKFGN